MAGLQQYQDPLKKVQPKIGAPVQNLGGMQPNTAPIANRPVAQPAVNKGTPGPSMFGSIRQGLQPLIDRQKPQAAPVPSPAPQLAAPVPAPVGTPPAAIAPPAAPAPAAPAASGGMYGRSGGTASSAQDGSLEDQLRSYITQGLGGVTSKAFIDRAKNQLGSAVEGQRAAGVRRINDDAIKRGLFRSGIPAEGIAAAETGARSALSSGIADILSRAEQQDIAGRESAAGTAGNLLGMNRSWDQYEQQRADEQAARAAANRQEDTSFVYIDPDTGEQFTMDESWF